MPLRGLMGSATQRLSGCDLLLGLNAPQGADGVCDSNKRATQTRTRKVSMPLRGLMGSATTALRSPSGAAARRLNAPQGADGVCDLS